MVSTGPRLIGLRERYETILRPLPLVTRKEVAFDVLGRRFRGYSLSIKPSPLETLCDFPWSLCSQRASSDVESNRRAGSNPFRTRYPPNLSGHPRRSLGEHWGSILVVAPWIERLGWTEHGGQIHLYFDKACSATIRHLYLSGRHGAITTDQNLGGPWICYELMAPFWTQDELLNHILVRPALIEAIKLERKGQDVWRGPVMRSRRSKSFQRRA
jgi:hypothetical protein